MRIFNGSMLSVNSSNEQQIKSYFDLNAQSSTRPTFIVGELEDDLRQKLNNNSINNKTLLVYFPYGKDNVDKFNSNMAINDTVQPTGYYAKNGLLRIFYNSAQGPIFGVSFDGKVPILDVTLKPN